jgi:hypothetical protein
MPDPTVDIESQIEEAFAALLTAGGMTGPLYTGLPLDYIAEDGTAIVCNDVEPAGAQGNWKALISVAVFTDPKANGEDLAAITGRMQTHRAALRKARAILFLEDLNDELTNAAANVIRVWGVTFRGCAQRPSDRHWVSRMDFVCNLSPTDIPDQTGD